MDRALPWIALLLSLGGIAYNAGKQDANAEATAAAQEGSVRRHDAQEAEIRKVREDLRTEIVHLRDDLSYLCNERRRDNAEAGRPANGGC